MDARAFVLIIVVGVFATDCVARKAIMLLVRRDVSEILQVRNLYVIVCAEK